MTKEKAPKRIPYPGHGEGGNSVDYNSENIYFKDYNSSTCILCSAVVDQLISSIYQENIIFQELLFTTYKNIIKHIYETYFDHLVCVINVIKYIDLYFKKYFFFALFEIQSKINIRNFDNTIDKKIEIDFTTIPSHILNIFYISQYVKRKSAIYENIPVGQSRQKK